MTTHEPGALEVLVTSTVGAVAGPIYRDYIDSLGLRGDERVLDFGSGAGIPARYLAERLSQGGGRLTCVDISHVWMEVCQRRLRHYRNVDFKLGPVESLQLPDAGYDLIFIHFVLHDIPASDRPRVLRALCPALAPSGRLCVREPLRFISQTEIRALLEASCLREESSRVREIPTQGMAYEGVYVKAGGTPPAV